MVRIGVKIKKISRAKILKLNYIYLFFLILEPCCHGEDGECSDVWSVGEITNEQECLDYHDGQLCQWTCPHYPGSPNVFFAT